MAKAPLFFTLLFVGLKLTDHIDWSWWLVLLPAILSAAVTVTRDVMNER